MGKLSFQVLVPYHVKRDFASSTLFIKVVARQIQIALPLCTWSMLNQKARINRKILLIRAYVYSD